MKNLNYRNYNKMKDRLIYIDRLKGFAIFLVVMGHVIQNNVANGTQNALFQIIYSFHMPLFFFLSGYIADKTTKINTINTFLKFIKNKSISLLLPMLIWPLIHKYCFTNDVDFSFDTVFSLIINEIKSPGLWFLKMLFEVFICYSLFYIISNWLRFKNKIITDSSIIILILGILISLSFILNDNSFITFSLNFSFFMFGVLVSKYDFFKKILENKLILSFSLILFILLVGHYNFSEQDLIKMKLLKLVISILASIVFYSLSKMLIFNSKTDSYICLFGKKSLIIYVTHFAFFSILPKINLLPHDASFILVFLITTPISVFLILFCIMIGKIVALLPFTNLLFYGIRSKDILTISKNV